MPKPIAERLRTEITPSPALERRTRRNFTTEYKLRILSEADACGHGGIGAMLRREHLYSNQLQQWRREFAAEGVAGLSKTVPGPSPARCNHQHEDRRRRRTIPAPRSSSTSQPDDSTRGDVISMNSSGVAGRYATDGDARFADLRSSFRRHQSSVLIAMPCCRQKSRRVPVRLP
jgi:transposase